MKADFAVKRVLIVDDDEASRVKYAALVLNRPAGEGVSPFKTEVAVATTAREASQMLVNASSRDVPFDLLVTDLFMTPDDGTALIHMLPPLGFTSDALDVILVSGRDDAQVKAEHIAAAQSAWRAAGGRPFKCVFRVEVPSQDDWAFCNEVWGSLYKHFAPRAGRRGGTKNAEKTFDWRQHFVTSHDPLVRWIETIGLPVSRKDVSILITGPSGVGKERLARMLHASSRRGSFQPVNVSAQPENLFESQMFGYARGAFTGALQDTPGHIELADSGTLFLDEIADLALPLQVKLHRVLQDKRVTRLGAKSERKIDFRLISATSQDLQQRLNDGSFREDFYYRICNVWYELPSLSQRPEDIPLLIQTFWTTYGSGEPIAPTLIAELQQRTWDAEIRGIENYCRLLAAFVPDGEAPTRAHIARADEAQSLQRSVVRSDHLDMPWQRTLHSWFLPRVRDAAAAGRGIDHILDVMTATFGGFFANDLGTARDRIYESWRRHTSCCVPCRELADALPGSRTRKRRRGSDD